MAFIELKCKKCGHVFEEIVATGEKYPPCERCGGETEQVYSGKCYGIGKSSGCAGNCSGNCGGCSGCGH